MRAPVILLFTAFILLFKLSFAQIDSLLPFKIGDKPAENQEMKKMLTDFSKTTIQRIVFSKASDGCFHNYEDHVTYKNSNGKFMRGYREATQLAAMMLPDEMPDTISQQLVEGFVSNLPDLYNKQARIDELGFTWNDYDSCKKNIRQLKNNPDFTRLFALVDSVKNIKQTTFNKYLRGEFHLNSTTVNNLNIKLVNTQKEVLEISYSYCEDQPYFFAWKIQLNGLKTSSAAIEINRFLTSTFPDFLNDKGKVVFIQDLVKVLYQDGERYK